MGVLPVSHEAPFSFRETCLGAAALGYATCGRKSFQISWLYLEHRFTNIRAKPKLCWTKNSGVTRFPGRASWNHRFHRERRRQAEQPAPPSCSFRKAKKTVEKQSAGGALISEPSASALGTLRKKRSAGDAAHSYKHLSCLVALKYRSVPQAFAGFRNQRVFVAGRGN